MAFTAVAVVAGLLAALLPARRASRLNVLERAAVRVGRYDARGGRSRPPLAVYDPPAHDRALSRSWLAVRLGTQPAKIDAMRRAGS